MVNSTLCESLIVDSITCTTPSTGPPRTITNDGDVGFVFIHPVDTYTLPVFENITQVPLHPIDYFNAGSSVILYIILTFLCGVIVFLGLKFRKKDTEHWQGIRALYSRVRNQGQGQAPRRKRCEHVVLKVNNLKIMIHPTSRRNLKNRRRRYIQKSFKMSPHTLR